MQQLFPVGWDTSGRARRRLIFRMPTRSGQARTVEEIARAIVVEPPLTRLETRDDRMAGRVMMFRRVLVRRRVAAADMTAFGAPAQMKPPAACRQTFLAAGPARLSRGIDAVSLRFHGACLVSCSRKGARAASTGHTVELRQVERLRPGVRIEGQVEPVRRAR